MHSNNAIAGFLVVLALVGAVGPGVIGGQPAASAAGGQPHPSSAACDYADLYNETTDSIVLVRQERGQGSGFVYEVTANGTSYVVTNQHVLGDADRVEVSFSNGRARVGTVVGTAATADLGVVRVNDTPDFATALPVADAAPRPGQQVAALGSPFGLRNSITHGIISSTDRAVPTDRGFVIPDVVQTDAPINPGNSGGPLVTCDGRVIGVNTAGIPAGRAENIGFAISASLIDRVVPALVENGTVRFAFLGVQTVDVTMAVAEINDLETTRGVMVVGTIEGSPAEGVLRPAEEVVVDGQRLPVGGDVIVAIDGRPVRSAEDLSSYLALEASPGDRVTLAVIRNGERRTVDVTLAERPSSSTA